MVVVVSCLVLRCVVRVVVQFLRQSERTVQIKSIQLKLWLLSGGGIGVTIIIVRGVVVVQF